jgi:nitrous oxidase accessory protein NosD
VQVEWHPLVIEEAKEGCDGHLGIVSWDWYLMVLFRSSVLEKTIAGFLDDKVQHVGQGIYVWLCDQIQAVEVAWSLGAFRLSHHV